MIRESAMTHEYPISSALLWLGLGLVLKAESGIDRAWTRQSLPSRLSPADLNGPKGCVASCIALRFLDAFSFQNLRSLELGSGPIIPTCGDPDL
jgi:hypothetical protein